jgi:hypothetical protein
MKHHIHSAQVDLHQEIKQLRLTQASSGGKAGRKSREEAGRNR